MLHLDEILSLPVEKLIPQSVPMVLVDSVVNYAEGHITTEVNINENSLFMDQNKVPVWIGIEYMAQTIAAYSGIQSLKSGKEVKIGFLIGSRSVEYQVEAFELGAVLNIQAALLYTDNIMGVFECRIEEPKTKKLLSKAKLNVYQPEDVQKFLKDL